MTELLYLPSSGDVTTFTASVARCESDSLILDGTYFYPGGGGQPADRGWLEWKTGCANVVGVRKDHGHVRHEIDLREGTVPKKGTIVEGRIDENRRLQLSRMHTAQHLISRIALDEYGAHTVSNQVTVEESMIDFDCVTFNSEDIAYIERRANELIDANIPVTKTNQSRIELEEDIDEGRAQMDLIPPSVDPLRVVRIGEYDVCPCGGTHVSKLGDIERVDITNHRVTEDGLSEVKFCLNN